MWDIMTMLLRGSAEYVKESKELCMLDFFPVTKLDGLFPSPRVLNTHYRLDVLPSQFRNQKTVIGERKLINIKLTSNSVIKIVR